MYYTYVILKNDKYYIGSTRDLAKRFKQHQAESENCKLKYYEAYSSRSAAQIRERKLKHYGSAWNALKKRIED